MAQFDIKSLTAIGANDLARALNGERITWDYMQASTDYFSNDVANLTTLTNVIKNLKILSAKQVADGQFDVTSRFSSTDVNKQIIIRTYGLFAHFNTETPALVAIISDENGDVLYPVSQTTNPQDLQQTMSLVFPNPDGKPIPYVISNSGYAMDTEVLHIANDETATGTKTFQRIKISNTKFPSLVQTDGQSITLDGGTTELAPADDSKVVHTTGDETIDGKKKFDTDPTDSAGNAYAKTVDVNQQLDKKVNVADMRKPASDVAGIEEVNFKQDKIGYTPADDSKVAHLSGANNFDTIPTVDDNPLLLASSLPSDLARTGQDQEFTGKNTFDTAPIDKKTGNPYITKDGVPKVDPSVMVKRTLTATDDVLALDPGTYSVWGTAPKNYPTVISLWSTVVVRALNNVQTDGLSVTITDVYGSQLVNNQIGTRLAWSGWQLPNTRLDTNFTAKLQQNGQDVALASNTIARNPDTGTVSETNTFTQPQTFSIAPVINDASTSKGDNQAATMADLKSLENSAWHQLNLASENPKWSDDSLGLYKIDSSENMITLVLSGSFTELSNNLMADFSGVITSITSISGYLNCVNDSQINNVHPYPRNDKIFAALTLPASKYAFGNLIIHYDKLV